MITMKAHELVKYFPLRYNVVHETLGNDKTTFINESFFGWVSDIPGAFRFAGESHTAAFASAVRETRPKWNFFTWRYTMLDDIFNALRAKEDTERLNPIKFIRQDMNEDIKIKTPFFVKPGDVIYVAVTRHNNLPPGVYKFTITSVELGGGFDGAYTGISFIAMDALGEVSLCANSHSTDDHYATSQMYWSIYQTREEATSFFVASMKEQVALIENVMKDLGVQ